MTKVNYISVAKKSAAIQIKELKKINKVFNKNFIKAVDIIHKAKGKVVCSGVGKSGLIARKVSASLSSVGISSFFLDPNSAIHGDLGQIDKRDVLIVFSYSGNTSELTNLLKYSNRFGIKSIGVPTVCTPDDRPLLTLSILLGLIALRTKSFSVPIPILLPTDTREGILETYISVTTPVVDEFGIS